MTTSLDQHSPARRRLGRTGPRVTSPGLGAMGLSGAYGAVDDDEGVRVIHAYLDAGGTLIDTADFYGSGHNEALIGRALRGRDRDDVVLSVKFGARRAPDGTLQGVDAHPAALRNFLTYSLQRLGVDHVDVYRPARLDPAVPIEDTVGAIAELVEQGWVRHVGLSEVGAATIRRAAAVTPISDLQIEYSLLQRDLEDEILPTCRELGVGITAYGVLSRGLIGGSGTLEGGRRITPRFADGNRQHNEALVARLADTAERRGVTVAQLALAWVAARGDDIVPVVGARRVEQVTTMLEPVTLSAEEATRAGRADPARRRRRRPVSGVRDGRPGQRAADHRLTASRLWPPSQRLECAVAAPPLLDRHTPPGGPDDRDTAPPRPRGRDGRDADRHAAGGRAGDPEAPPSSTRWEARGGSSTPRYPVSCRRGEQFLSLPVTIGSRSPSEWR